MRVVFICCSFCEGTPSSAVVVKTHTPCMSLTVLACPIQITIYDKARTLEMC